MYIYKQKNINYIIKRETHVDYLKGKLKIPFKQCTIEHLNIANRDNAKQPIKNNMKNI